MGGHWFQIWRILHQNWMHGINLCGWNWCWFYVMLVLNINTYSFIASWVYKSSTTCIVLKPIVNSNLYSVMLFMFWHLKLSFLSRSLPFSGECAVLCNTQYLYTCDCTTTELIIFEEIMYELLCFCHLLYVCKQFTAYRWHLMIEFHDKLIFKTSLLFTKIL